MCFECSAKPSRSTKAASGDQLAKGELDVCSVDDGFLALPRLAHKAGNIEDQADAAVRKDGRASHAGQRLKQLAERFDHGLHLAVQHVGHEAERLIAVSDDDDV